MLEVDVRHVQGDFTLSCRFASERGVTGVLGPSGAGKSTLLRIIAGLIRPRQGRVVINGRCVFDHRHKHCVAPHRRRIGYVFQHAHLFPHLGVAANLRYGMRLARHKPAAGRFAQVVELLDIGYLLGRRTIGLSGGEQQRVALGRALLANPELLLLDEPLAALDESRRNELLPYFERLRDEQQLPIVYVSHQLEDLLRLTNRQILALHNGALQFAGSTTDFLAHSGEIAGSTRRAGALLRTRLLGSDAHALSRLALADQTLFVPRLAQPAGSEVVVHIQARDVMLALQRPADVSALNMLAVTLVGLETTGAYAVDAHLDCHGQPLLARITRKSVERLQLAPGMRVHALIKSLALVDQAWQHVTW